MNALHSFSWAMFLLVLALNLVVIVTACTKVGLELLERWNIRLAREIAAAERAHFRVCAILLRSEFECFGGPYDGEIVVWRRPELSMYVTGGCYYRAPDNRLHFESLPALIHHTHRNKEQNGF